jgi:mRNA-degrading endonuclease RelE of RelBE toxin-antitoxin system
MNKEIFVEFSENSSQEFKELEKRVALGPTKFEVQLLKCIEREKSNLKDNPQHGTHIPRTSIPGQAAERYGTDRLWKLELVGYWRLIYTLVGDEQKLIVFFFVSQFSNAIITQQILSW